MHRTVLVFALMALAVFLFACDDFRWHGAGADGDMDAVENGDANDGDSSDGDHSADGDGPDGDSDISGDGDAPDGDADKDLDNADGDADERGDSDETETDSHENDGADGDAADGDSDNDADTGDVEESDGESDPDWNPEFVCAGGVCTDVATNFEWQENGAANSMTYAAAVSYCENLETDSGGWRLPNISELRTLVRNCADIETGGGCGVLDVCPPCGVYSGGACLILATCKGLNCTPSACTDDGGPEGCYWSPDIGGVCGWFWSLSAETLNTCQYVVDFVKGEVGCSVKSSSSGYARCVR